MLVIGSELHGLNSKFAMDEELQFFDAQEDIESSSETSGDSIEINRSIFGFDGFVEGSFVYDLWNQSPLSVNERRTKFSRMTGLNLDRISGDREAHTARENGEAMPGILKFEDGFYSSRSSMSCLPTDRSEVLEESISKKNFSCSDGTADCNCSGQLGMAEDSSSNYSLKSSRQQNESMPANPRHFEGMPRRSNKSWLRRLSSIAGVFHSHDKRVEFKSNDGDEDRTFRVERVKVRQSKKQLKELSALYTGHDIQAHEGAILAMKFSLDGRYLASGSKDGIVKVWQVIEDERSDERDIPVLDQSCIYFSMNHLSELKSLHVDKDKLLCNSASLKKTPESACVVFPPKIFRISEKPLHEFYGHSGDILDLSWSQEKYLLSSSVDKTVRLWRVGINDCLKVFSHSNYVTCVQFNPVDENYFISGSIDGKVRIWGISCCQVVDWINIREIVTAVCFRPDRQGCVVGSIDGNCRFYTISDNHLELEDQIGLHSKKSVNKKITSFQFHPQDPSMLMVSSADSQIRILHGPNLVCKYNGIRNAGNKTTASLTSDGKYIISAGGDSNVYVWNSGVQNDTALSRAKRSYEHFSTNASIAIPWTGFDCMEGGFDREISELSPFSLSARFSLNKEFFLESLPKGCATWPEEKLPTSNNLRMHKSRHEFLKESCRSTSESGAWGLVIVTAGWDGRIRSFHNYGLPALV